MPDSYMNPNVVQPGLSNFLHDQFKLNHEVHNAAVIKPEQESTEPGTFAGDVLVPEITNYWNNVLRPQIPDLPEDYMEFFKGKTHTVTSPYAGNGHFKEAMLWAHLMSDVFGMDGWIYQPEELLSEFDRAKYKIKSDIHALMQMGILDEKSFDELFNSLRMDIVSRKTGYDKAHLEAVEIREHALKKMEPKTRGEMNDELRALRTLQEGIRFSLASAGYLDDSDALLSNVARAATKVVDQNQLLASTALKFFVKLDRIFTEAPLVDVVAKVYQLQKETLADPNGEIALMETSHANTLRAFCQAVFEGKLKSKGIDPSFAGRVMSHIPDPGFGRKADKNVGTLHITDNVATQLFALEGANTDTVTIVPTTDVKDALFDMFGNRGPIVPTGELLPSITPKMLREKWDAKTKNIALMISGNNTNREYIRRAVMEFISKGYECTKGYNLIVCLYDKDQRDVFHQDNDMEILQKELPNFPNICFVKTSNMLEMAEASKAVVDIAHVKVGQPPGEGVFMDSSSGCVYVSSPTHMVNEIRNQDANMHRTLLSSYPPPKDKEPPMKDRWDDLYELFKGDERDRAQKEVMAEVGLGVDPGSDFVEYLNNLFGTVDMEQFAINAYLSCNHTSTLHMLLTGMTQMVKGGLTKEDEDKQLEFMHRAEGDYMEWVEGQMRLHFNYTKDEVIRRRLGNIPDGGPLPAADLGTTNRIALLQDHHDKHHQARFEVDERNKRNRKFALAGLVAAGLGISVAYFALKKSGGKRQEK